MELVSQRLRTTVTTTLEKLIKRRFPNAEAKKQAIKAEEKMHDDQQGMLSGYLVAINKMMVNLGGEPLTPEQCQEAADGPRKKRRKKGAESTVSVSVSSVSGGEASGVSASFNPKSTTFKATRTSRSKSNQQNVLDQYEGFLKQRLAQLKGRDAKKSAEGLSLLNALKSGRPEVNIVELESKIRTFLKTSGSKKNLAVVAGVLGALDKASRQQLYTGLTQSYAMRIDQEMTTATSTRSAVKVRIKKAKKAEESPESPEVEVVPVTEASLGVVLEGTILKHVISGKHAGAPMHVRLDPSSRVVIVDGVEHSVTLDNARNFI